MRRDAGSALLSRAGRVTLHPLRAEVRTTPPATTSPGPGGATVVLDNPGRFSARAELRLSRGLGWISRRLDRPEKSGSIDPHARRDHRDNVARDALVAGLLTSKSTYVDVGTLARTEANGWSQRPGAHPTASTLLSSQSRRCPPRPSGDSRRLTCGPWRSRPQAQPAAPYGDMPEDLWTIMADDLGYRLFDLQGACPYQRDAIISGARHGAIVNWLALPR